MKKIILITLLLSSKICFAQWADTASTSSQDSTKIKSERIFAVGILCETLIEQKHEFQSERSYKEISNNFRADGFSVGASLKFLIMNKTIFELRPGLTFDSYLIGLDGGIFIRRKLSKIFFGIIGADIHGTATSSSSSNSGWATRGGWYLFPGASIGIKINKSSSFLLSIYKASIGNYYNSYSAMDGRRFQADLKWLFKIGVEFGPEL